MRHLRTALASFLLCSFCLAPAWLPALPARAQDSQVSLAGGWTPGTMIPQYVETTFPPYLVADQNRSVHAFASLPMSQDPSDEASREVGIFYRQWTAAGGWTSPVDIMLTPLKYQARVKSVFLDDAGVLHMVFFGGDDLEANIYYSWAPAAAAGAARSWSPPVPIGPNAVAPEVAAITGDGGDRLAMLYGGNLGEGNSLYVVYSDDGGGTWSEPFLLFSTYALDSKPFDYSVHYGESGRVYAAWNVTDQYGQNLAGFFAYMDDIASRQWSEPKVIAPSIGLGFATPSLIEYKGSVFLMYNNGMEGQESPVMWLVRSDDGGKTFSNPVRPFSNHIGRNGPVAFVVDGNGDLHGFFGERIPGGFDGSTDLHGMWHSVWLGGNWGPVRPVVSGPPSSSFDPSDPSAVASQGNVILLTWRTDPGREIRSTFYAYSVLDAPEAPLEPLPNPETLPLPAADAPSVESTLQNARPAATQAALLASREVSVRTDFSKEPGNASAAGPAMPLVGALVPTLLFIVGALLLGGALRRK